MRSWLHFHVGPLLTQVAVRWSKAYHGRWYAGGDYHEDGHRVRLCPERSIVSEKVGPKRGPTE